MPITITTLNNEAAVAKTYAEVGKDRNSSTWINSTDTTGTKKVSIDVRQRVLGTHAPNGSPVRQATVSCVISVPIGVVMPNGNSKTMLETVKVNLSIVSPEVLNTLTATDRKDAVAYIRNLCVAAVVDQLSQGMV